MNNDSQKIIIVIIVCIAILAGTAIFFAMNSGLIFSEISSEITSGVSSGSQYEELASLKANYTELETKFNNTRQEIYSSSNEAKEDAFTSAQLELVRANSAIEDVESALKSGKPSEEIDKRIKTAEKKLNIANQAYNNL